MTDHNSKIPESIEEILKSSFNKIFQEDSKVIERDKDSLIVGSSILEAETELSVEESYPDLVSCAKDLFYSRILNTENSVTYEFQDGSAVRLALSSGDDPSSSIVFVRVIDSENEVERVFMSLGRFSLSSGESSDWSELHQGRDRQSS